MARARFFNGASTLSALRFGDFTPDVITSTSATRVVLTGADGQQFIAFGSNFGFNAATGKFTGRITRLDWLDPDGVLLGRVDQVSYPAQRAFDALFADPSDPDAPEGPGALFNDALSGDDLIVGDATVGGGFYDEAFNRLYVGTGDDTVRGGAGDEFVEVGDGGTVNFNGGGGRDRIEYLYGSFEGTRGIDADLATGRIANPFGGIDTVKGVEEIEGTILSDTIRGDNGANGLTGGAGGRDRIAGRGGDDVISINFDVFETGPDDTLEGGAGNDTLRPGLYADRVDGGAGRDEIWYFQDFTDPKSIVVNLLDWSKTTGNAADDTITGVETFVVAWGSDATTSIRFVGDEGGNGFISRGRASDTLTGGAGNDTLDAGRDEDAAGDRLFGGTGNDSLIGAGAERMDGGAGRDTVAFHEFAIVTLDLKAPANSTGEAEGDTYISIEAFVGVANLRGSDSGDRVVGTDFFDTLDGGGGNDTLSGADRNDTLSGGAGNDSIEGQGEADILTGGRGADIFYWRSLRDTGVAGETDPSRRDVVTDFGDGADALRFRAAGFAGLDDGFRLAQGLAPTAKLAGGAFLFDTDDHLLLWDRDGSGAAAPVLLMTLDDVNRLARADLDIV